MNYTNLNTKIPLVVPQLPEAIEFFQINTPLRLAHFLAQCSHESGDFKLTTENLNYSVKGLMSVFHKYFPNEAIAKQYERQPEKIANKVYANRMGNGSEQSGDGYKFRGRGYIQLTGKDNYKAFGDHIKVDLLTTPDLVATKYPLTSAAFFFNKNKLWDICDKGDTIDVVTMVSKRVNGGTIGLEDRIQKFRLYISLIK
jgi:putative chitinase